MPCDHGLGLDDDQGAIPSRPESSQEDPEEAILVAEPRPSLIALVGCELLSQGGVLKGRGGMGKERSP